MAASLIALRFRDSTPGVDTIGEHYATLLEHRAVWWGWWRKSTEQVDAPDVPDGRMEILLVDRETERMFLAKSERFTANKDEVEHDLVPAYYREHMPEIAGFFLLTAIESVEYDPAVGDSFGERTLVGVGPDDQNATTAHVAEPAHAAGRSCVLHLSDLHFGADYGFLPQGEAPQIGDARRPLTECLIADLDRIGMRDKIAAVVVTGDFITRGDWNDAVRNVALREFEVMRGALHLEKDQLIAVPGNHDIVRYPDGDEVDIREFAVKGQTSVQHEREFRTFVDELVDRNWRELLNYVRRVSLGEVDLLLCVLNSCTITATKWTEYGFVGAAGIDAIKALREMPIERPSFRFLAIHHHLLPVAEVEAPSSRGVTLALDASKILAAAQHAGVHVALHGHQHKPKVAIYQSLPFLHAERGVPIHVVSNGSASAAGSRLPLGERNTYCLFEIEDNCLRLRIRELRADGEAGAELLNQVLDTLPSTP